MQSEKSPKSKISSKTRIYSSVFLVGVLLTGWGLYGDDSLKSKIFGDDMEWEEVPVGQDKNTDTVSVNGSFLEGRLENSDNTERGNLKLISSMGQIYVRTARDFNALIGFDVLMTIDGSLDKFTLINIEKRVEKDGYIQAQ